MSLLSLRSRLVVRALHMWFRVSRGLTLGVRTAVIDGEGRVFLIRHTYVPGWHLPGGGVETGETALDAATRELMEEGRIAVTAPPRLHGVFFNGHVSRRDHVLVFEIRAFEDRGPRVPDLEIAEAGWFPMTDLPPGTTAGTRARLHEIVTGEVPSPHWSGDAE